MFPHRLLLALPTISRIISGKVFILRLNFSLYILSIYLFREAMYRLRMNQFLLSTDLHFDDLFHNIREFQCAVKNDSLNNDIVVSKWNQCIDLAKEFKRQRVEFTRQESQSKSFEHRGIFLDSIVPILRAMTHSFREKDCSFHLLAVQRAIPLFFSFDCTNYADLAPLYFGDCLKPEEKFPMLHQKFMKGDFCVQQSPRASSAVPMGQALEQSCNKTTKGKGGVIEITTRKATTAKWNLIKHEKMQYIKVLYDFCGLLTDDECSLHHDFSDAVTAQDIKFVENIIDFVEQRNNPFKKDNCNIIKNFATGTIINQDTTNLLVSCSEYG